MVLTNAELAQQVESMVDARSVASVLVTLAEVCGEKAEHIKANYQDKALAKEWAKVARMIDSLAGKVYL